MAMAAPLRMCGSSAHLHLQRKCKCAEGDGLTVNALDGGALVVDLVVGWALAVEGVAQKRRLRISRGMRGLLITSVECSVFAFVEF